MNGRPNPPPNDRGAPLARVRGSYTTPVEIRLGGHPSAPPAGPCVNHPERVSAARCPRCRSLFCDPCVAFVVNGEAWCEPCGNSIEESLRPRWVVFGLVLALGWLCMSSMGFAIFLIFKVRLYFWVLLLAGYAGVFRYAWRIAVPMAIGTAPRIERRARGASLPPRTR